jgi:uncharacterized protein (DUF1501 family)
MGNRREFLQKGCAALSTAAFINTVTRFGVVDALAQEIGQAADYKALVCVFLNGGNDAWNSIVPLDEHAAYAAARPSIALDAATLLPITPPSDGRRFGLHPSLLGLHALWGWGEMAVVANVGPLLAPLTRALYQSRPDLRPPNLLSHSDQTYQWQTAVAYPTVATGWGGRTADRAVGMNGAATFPSIITLAGNNVFGTGAVVRAYETNGQGSVALSGVSGNADAVIRFNALKQVLGLNRDIEFVRAAGDTLSKAINTNEMVTSVLASVPPLGTVFPATGLGDQLKMVARIISARGQLDMRRQIFFCSLGGFDTHSGQITAQGNQLAQLSSALMAFHAATVEMGIASSVTAFTHSDFGRALVSNGGGTDHGWGSCHFVVGGAVRGGNFYGTWPTLAVNGPDDSGNQGRMIPSTAVEQYCATLAKWYGIPATEIPAVFPNVGRFSSPDLGFML